VLDGRTIEARLRVAGASAFAQELDFEAPAREPPPNRFDLARLPAAEAAAVQERRVRYVERILEGGVERRFEVEDWRIPGP
jgi:hypothetical protein